METGNRIGRVGPGTDPKLAPAGRNQTSGNPPGDQNADLGEGQGLSVQFAFNSTGTGARNVCPAWQARSA